MKTYEQYRWIKFAYGHNPDSRTLWQCWQFTIYGTYKPTICAGRFEARQLWQGSVRDALWCGAQMPAAWWSELADMFTNA